MGNEIITNEDCENTKTNLLLKEFYGGKDRGSCFVLTKTDKEERNSYITITDKEMRYLIYKLLIWEWNLIQDKDTLYDGHIRYLNVIEPLIEYIDSRYIFGGK